MSNNEIKCSINITLPEQYNDNNNKSNDQVINCVKNLLNRFNIQKYDHSNYDDFRELFKILGKKRNRNKLSESDINIIISKVKKLCDRFDRYVSTLDCETIREIYKIVYDLLEDGVVTNDDIKILISETKRLLNYYFK